jgi:hypothetical protein
MFGFGFVGAYIWMFLLFALQFLHVFWFYLIVRMIVKLLTVGVDKDERSDDEDEELAEEDTTDVKQKKFATKKTN